MLYQLSYFRKVSGRRWIRTTEDYVSRFTVCPIWPLWYSPKYVTGRKIFRNFEPMEGVEPTTPRLQITCSSQLSYIGNVPLIVRECKDRY